MKKIWLKNYPKGVPAEIDPDMYESIIELFLQSCRKYSDRPAYTNLGSTISYHQVQELAMCFAAYLQQTLGLRKGQRIAIVLPNILQYPVVMFGALLAGLVVVNINPLYTASEMGEQLQIAEVDAVVILDNFAHVLATALTEIKIKHVIVTKLGDLLGFPKSFLVNFIVKTIKRKVPSWHIPAAMMFKQVIKQGRKLTFTPVSLASDDLAYLQFTGGTTGVAKAAMLTHRNMLANVEQIHAWVGEKVVLGEEIIITAIPLYHIFCLTLNCLAFTKFGGTNVLITNPRDIGNFIKELSRHQFTMMSGVNTLYNALANHPTIKQVDFSALKIAISGGMAVQKAVAEQWREVTGKNLFEGYGLTEASPVVTVNPLDKLEYTHSIGLPLPSTEVKVINEHGLEVEPGNSGELCVRGPQVMQGYWHEQAETDKILDREGWLHTGDIVSMDAAGYLYLVERKKDLIDVSGFNVYPNEVEDIIVRHPGVLEAAVVGIADEYSGEAVKAFVVKTDPLLSEADIRNFCRRDLTAYKVPKHVEFCKELPKNNVGKILRRSLREKSEERDPSL